MLSPVCCQQAEGDSDEPSEEGTEDSSSSECLSVSEADRKKSSGWGCCMGQENTGVPVVAENPFATRAHWTAYEVFKLIVVGLTLFPVRLVLVFVFFLSVMLAVTLATLGLPLEEDNGCFCFNKPLPAWRQALLRPCSALCRGILWCVGFWCINFVDHREDRAQMPNIVVVAPHMTFVDMLVVCWTFPPFISFVADATILRAPGGQRIAIATQTIFLKMRDAISRKKAAELIERRALPEWEGLPTAIFPEGRITNGGKLIQFKPGAFKAGQPVLPVLLRYPYRYLDPSSTGSNWGPLWFIRIMTQFVNHCTVEVLSPYMPCEEEVVNPTVYASQVRELMAEMLGVGTTEHTVDDAFLYRAARYVDVGGELRVESMRRMFNVDLKQLLQWLETFQKVDQDHSGIIDREEFRKVLGEDDDQAADRLFDFFDTDDSGTMDYREFVQGLGLLSGECSAETQAKLAFHIYDEERNGKIPKSRLRFALDRAFNQNSVLEILPAEAELGMPSDSSSTRNSGPRVSTRRRLSRNETVADLLLPEPQATRQSLPCGSLGSRRTSISYGTTDEEIDYETFCELVKRNPQVLESALNPLKRRMHDCLGV